MFSTIILALFKLGLPVGLTAYLLIGWMRDSGRIEAFASNKELDQKLKAIKKEGKEKKKQKKQAEKENFAIKKWMGFGGGFYGTAALFTYAYIEVGEVMSFIGKVLDLENWHIPELFDLILGFIINSFMNLLDALLWFQYFDLGSHSFAIPAAFLAAYAGYAVGARLANLHAAEGIGHVTLWRWWQVRKQQKVADAAAVADQEPQP